MLNELIAQDDLALFNSAGRINIGQIYFNEGMKDTKATFEVFIRADKNRKYFVLGGIHSIVEFLSILKFTEDQLQFLKEVYHFSEEYIDYLRKLRFSGDVWAMPEGTICFPNEPVFRITAPIIQIVLIEQFVMNTIMHQTMLATKFARVRLAAKNKIVGTTMVRSHGMESALKAVRLAKMTGIDLSAMALESYKRKDTKAESGMTTHFFIQSFDSQKEAFRAYFKHNAEKGMILIDTYGYDKGLKDFIEIAKEFELKGKKIRGAVLDSGNYLEISKKVRKELDDNGLDYVKIVAMGNLDEYKIDEIVKNNIPIDLMAVATEVLNSTDSPKLEVVFKMVEIEKEGVMKPVIKLSSEKVCYPHKKQVYALSDSDGNYKVRVVGLDEESYGKEILLNMVKFGKQIYTFPDISQIKDYFLNQVKKYPEELFGLQNKFEFPIVISERLKEIFEKTKSEMLN